jgi:hypothetical protein
VQHAMPASNLQTETALDLRFALSRRIIFIAFTGKACKAHRRRKAARELKPLVE